MDKKRGVLRKVSDYARKKSPWIVHMDCAGCNGCDIEIFATLSPRYDLERFGAIEKGNPRQADILIVAGAVSTKVRPRLKRIYEQMPEPKMVMAIGSCAITKGVFHDAYNICGPLDKIIPVDIYVPGCPPKPEAMLDAMLKALELWKKK
jgi:NADH-quinone oxidoreductase B subunit